MIHGSPLKVIEAKEQGTGKIEIWGDGTRTRSFMYIDDCIEGIERIMHSDVTEPLNLGSDKLVTINQLVDIVEGIANIALEREHDMSAPQAENWKIMIFSLKIKIN